jgi:hypothetical protein
LNSGLHACKAGILPLEPYLHHILLWLLGLWNYLPGVARNKILLISASEVGKIIGVSHWDLTKNLIETDMWKLYIPTNRNNTIAY